ncbi:hypothetical protein ZHAS_00013861 [Anopheles sinensis]|uniref:Secreted protein n=1 Tax=Anopheles sinensis TaxID=74873 RepID=A0A084W6Q4_ANOSI|nr:hypothetical protein ZHAS_00013861 [Anopheles sinensis]
MEKRGFPEGLSLFCLVCNFALQLVACNVCVSVCECVLSATAACSIVPGLSSFLRFSVFRAGSNGSIDTPPSIGGGNGCGLSVSVAAVAMVVGAFDDTTRRTRHGQFSLRDRFACRVAFEGDRKFH